VKLIIAVLFLLSAPAWATSYYLSPTGSDAANGLTTGTAWLSPNHSLNCGDTITAASGSYSATNFQSGKWGTVTCPSSNNVAWLICGTFDACKISATTQGMFVDHSYWGVQGWEITTSTTTSGACFTVAPSQSTPVTIHHIIFVNNVANGCMGSGFNQYNSPGSTTASVDYVAYVGNIAFNAAQGSTACYSGIGIYQPIASDTNSGTHMFIAGNFSYGNFDPSTCAGTASTDGEGIIIDTLDFSQGGGTPYTQQVYVANNIVAGNGSFGIEVFNNSAGSTHAPIYLKANTAWKDIQDIHQSKAGAGEIVIITAANTNASSNIGQTTTATAPGGGSAIYAFSVSGGTSTDTVAGNWLAGTSGNNTAVFSSTGFSYGTNTLGTSPAFTSPAIPSAPSCSGQTNVATCMAAMISNFTPTASGSTAYGYQTVSNTSITDALFPQWLCTSTGVLNANIPAGLVTPGCGVLSASGGIVVSNIEATSANWLSICSLGSCGSGSPGGTNPPASATQTFGNTTPAGSPTGTSMQMAVNTLASSTQTNVLYRYQAPATYDLATYFSTAYSFYLGANSAHASSFEDDENDFDQTENLQITFAHQCYQGNGLWQIANGVGGWVNTAISCSLSYSAWHTLVTAGHRIIGDTSCSGGFPKLYFDSLTIDGTVYPINQTLCAVALPSGYTSSLITQFQIDVGATTTNQTVTENLAQVTFSAGTGTAMITAGNTLNSGIKIQ
jgi:hypothetical protein